MFARRHAGGRECVELRPLAIWRWRRIFNLADEKVPVPMEEVVVSHPHRVGAAGLVGLRYPLMRVEGEVVADVSRSMQREVAELDLVRHRRVLRIVERALADPKRYRAVDGGRIQGCVAGALHVAPVRVERRHRRVAHVAVHAVRLREWRHGLRRTGADEEEGRRKRQSDNDDRAKGFHEALPAGGSVTTMVSVMFGCPGPQKMEQCTTYVPAFLGVKVTSITFPFGIVVRGMPS